MSPRARALAASFRRKHGFDGPPTPEWVVYRLKTRVWVKERAFPAELSGLLVRDAEWAVIWLNASQAKVRRRFTLFHELGHLLLHPSWALCYQASSRQKALTEREADDFAVEMLMPKAWVLRDMATIGVDRDRLARRYEVSRTAMGIRLHELGAG